MTGCPSVLTEAPALCPRPHQLFVTRIAQASLVLASLDHNPLGSTSSSGAQLPAEACRVSQTHYLFHPLMPVLWGR